MAQSITSTQKQINKNFSRSSVVRSDTMHASDMLSQLMNQQIIAGIESYIRSFSKMEIEILKYLNYYFKKWDGNIQIPIKNLMDRFGVSARWVHKLLKRIYDSGWVYTTNGGYGRKVTRRTFSERGKIVIRAITKGFGSLAQLTPKKSADYCADYSQGSTNYISTKVDISQGEPFSHEKNDNINKPNTDFCLKSVMANIRNMLVVKNE